MTVRFVTHSHKVIAIDITNPIMRIQHLHLFLSYFGFKYFGLMEFRHSHEDHCRIPTHRWQLSTMKWEAPCSNLCSPITGPCCAEFSSQDTGSFPVYSRDNLTYPSQFLFSFSYVFALLYGFYLLYFIKFQIYKNQWSHILC